MVDRKKTFVYDEYTANLGKLAANAGTTLELSRLCQRMYIADYINLEGIDLWLAKNALTAVFQVLKDYPKLRRRINYFGTLSGLKARKDDLIDFLYPNADRDNLEFLKEASDETAEQAAESFQENGLAIAFFSQIGNEYFGGIIIDETDFNRRSILTNLAHDESVGFSPRGCHSFRSVITHELGHVLDFWLKISENRRFKSKIKTLSSSYIQSNLSEYSSSNGQVYPAEVIAEGFAEYRCSNSPRELASFVGQLIDEEYKKQ